MATVRLSRPPVNALDDALLGELEAVLDEIETAGEVAVLHLASAEKAFCAGADLALMRGSLASPEGTETMLGVVRRMQRVFARLEAAPFVVIAEIGGAAMGGGLELALACDLRVAAIEAKLGLPEARLGLVPAAGGTQRLARLCGAGVAKRLILGAEVIDGGEAARLGLVHWAYPREALASRTREIVLRLAAIPPAALAAGKRCIAAAADPARDGFAEEIDATRRLYAHAETRRRVADFFAKGAS
ncbi:MAG TPA: enoyl-CoA hydratase/isomerase family protein [Casimicrobiaceae bacterium]